MSLANVFFYIVISDLEPSCSFLRLVSDQRESLSDLKKLAVASGRCSPRIILALSTEGKLPKR